MSNQMLCVEVVGAHALTPKDNPATVSAYVELQFDGQKFRTTVKEKDVNPVWNEVFYFNISDSASLPDRYLEAFVYHFDRAGNSLSLLGKVRIAGTSFVHLNDVVDLVYVGNLEEEYVGISTNTA